MNNFSQTKCGIDGCNSTSFEFVQDKPIGTDGNVAFLRCCECKRIISYSSVKESNIILDKILREIDDMKSKINL